jgi:pimeloyl-ACP methyl ester carboxylesterase
MTTTEATRRAFAERQDELMRFYGVDARSRFVEIDRPRMRVHLLEAGAGEPLVLIHGGDGEGALWAPLMAALQDDFHLYALDRPGCGLSDPFDYRDVDLRQHAGDFVDSVLDAPGLESATLVACSMGGFFALVTALDHPARVRRLALVGMLLGMISSAPLGLRVIAGVPGLSRRFMRSRATIEAQRAQYKQMFGMDPDTIPEPYLRSRVAGVSIPRVPGHLGVLLRRIAGLRGLKPGLYLGEELADVTAPALVL